MSTRRRAARAAWVVGLALAAGSCEAVAPTASTEGPAAPDPSTSPVESGGDQAAPPGDAPGDASGDAPDTPPTDGGGDASVEVDTVYAASVSGLTETATEVIQTAEAWQAAWARITSPLAPAPDAPAVDFETSQVVLLALGTRPSGGHGLELTGVERVEGALRIEVAEVAPGPGCVTTQAVTQPVLVLGLPVGSESVEVTREAVVRDCT